VTDNQELRSIQQGSGAIVGGEKDIQGFLNTGNSHIDSLQKQLTATRQKLDVAVKALKEAQMALVFYAHPRTYSIPSLYDENTGISIDTIEYTPISLDLGKVAKAALVTINNKYI
jgi:hypothetical protein